MLLFSISHAADKAYDLTPAVNAGDVDRINVRVEMQGELKLNADGKKVNRVPLTVVATLGYDEKVLQANIPERRVRTARHYRQAEADIRLAERAQAPRLSNDRQLIVADISGAKSTLFSPAGALTRDELDLIDVHCNSAIATALLPAKSVKIGESWAQDEATLCLLLGLEAVSQTDVKSKLSNVEGDVAMIEMSGSISGAVGGVATEIELKARYNFSLGQKRITWLATALREDRAIGHAEPGFEVTERLRLSIEPLKESPELSETALNGLPLDAASGLTLLSFQSSEGGFRLLHDRRWRVMVDRHDVTVLRYVDRGDLVAQCNISKLPDLPAGKHLQLEEFQADIKRTLGQHFGQFLQASQATNDEGLRVLRVVAAGVTAELPIQWIYCHVSNDQGQRAAFAFTMESKLAERFSAADQTLTDSFQFVRADDASSPSPTPASANTADASSKQGDSTSKSDF